jgi:hypothetical protein
MQQNKEKTSLRFSRFIYTYSIRTEHDSLFEEKRNKIYVFLNKKSSYMQ